MNKYLGVKGVHINSNLVSFQNRPRIYWTNICDLKQPINLHVNFQDFKSVDFDYCEQFKVNKTKSRLKMWSDGNGRNGGGQCSNKTHADKINCITTKQDRRPNSGLIEHGDFCRYITREELEQGQTLPKGYTKSVAYNQACKVVGNAWTVDVICHIFSSLKKKKQNGQITYLQIKLNLL